MDTPIGAISGSAQSIREPAPCGAPDVYPPPPRERARKRSADGARRVAQGWPIIRATRYVITPA